MKYADDVSVSYFLGEVIFVVMNDKY